MKHSFSMRTKGKRDYDVCDEREQHGHDDITDTQAANNVINIINHLPVENPTWDPKDIYANPLDRQFQCALDEQMTKIYDQNGHTHTDTKTSCTPSAGTKAKILEDNENDNDGEGVPIRDKDIVLTNNWEDYGDI